ncbi:glutamate 5-kinase [Alphaproteobacteria bacterium]|nr:glutamate 5-kinase [Alphaproteobacteria bacterium]
MKQLAEKVHNASCIVIKIGSALLVDEKTGLVKSNWIESLVKDIAFLKSSGKQVVIVSSGSIAIGRKILGLSSNTIKLEEKQAAAAVGQGKLVQSWAHYLAQHNITAGQILLAPDDTETRRRHLNARATIKTLLDLGVVPVVNENDTVTTYEIRFGDNDRLAARVAGMISADLLILLSDIDGLYSADPARHKNAAHIPDIIQITDEILSMGGSANASFASGGMATKLAAAQIATNAGADMIICDGLSEQPLTLLMNGARASLFHSATEPHTAREKWIAGALDLKGSIKIDDGAVTAIGDGKSLLPAGVTSVSGHFVRGDVISIKNKENYEIARGLSNYSHIEANQLKGRQSASFASIVGFQGRAELIHADDLVMMKLSREDNEPST